MTIAGFYKRQMEYSTMQREYKRRVGNVAIASTVLFVAGIANMHYNRPKIIHPENYVEPTPRVREYIERRANLETAWDFYDPVQATREDLKNSSDMPSLDSALNEIIKKRNSWAVLDSLKSYVRDVEQDLIKIGRDNSEEIDKYYEDILTVRNKARNLMGLSLAASVASLAGFFGYFGYTKLRLRKKENQLEEEIIKLQSDSWN